jgi:hypothetical protein
MNEPGVCARCGCSDDDPCPGGCLWANSSATLCSRCVDEHDFLFEPLFDDPTIECEGVPGFGCE